MSIESRSDEDLVNEQSRWDGRPIIRSMARRQRQIAYKQWSQDRTDEAN